MSISTASHTTINPKLLTPEAQQPRPLPKARPNQTERNPSIEHIHRRHAAAAAQTSQTQPDQAGNTGSEPQTLTLQGLLEVWGMSNGSYDLTGDGTVGVQDMLRLLSQGGEMPNPNAEPESPTAAPTRGATSNTPAGGNQEPQVLTLESMMKSFDSGDAAHDLTGDGVVNVSDLLELLNNGGTMRVVTGGESGENNAADQIAQSRGNTDSNDSQQTQTVTLEGVLRAFGSSNESFDFNADGTVNVSDLLEILSNGGEMQITMPGNENTGAGEGQSSDESRRAFVINTENLTNAFGSDSQVFDLNGDGTVSVPDLLELLANGGQIQVTPDSPGARAAVTGAEQSDAAASEPALASANDAASDAASEARRSRLGEQQVQQLGNALLSGFEQAGFTSSPPTNLPDLLSQFDLSRDDRSSLLSQIRQRYPEGLGVNLVG